MTKEMITLYEKLTTVQVRNLASAYSYLTDEMNVMDSNFTLSKGISKEALKNTNKGYKRLKKILKGKIEANTSDVLDMFEEDSYEHFFLECLVRLADINQLSK